MRLGLPVSLALHGVILGWALISIQSTPPLKINEPQPVEVAIISEDALVRLKQGSRDAKLIESQASNKPKPETEKPITPKAKEAVAPPTAAEPPPPVPAPVEKVEPPPPAKPKVDEIEKKLAALPPEPPPLPANSKRKHRRKDATVGSRYGWWWSGHRRPRSGPLQSCPSGQVGTAAVNVAIV